MKIITTFICPAVPDRCFDWTAVGEDYEPGDPIGLGHTAAEAEADLAGSMQDAADYLADLDARR